MARRRNSIASWVLAVLLAVVFFLAAVGKLSGGMAGMFEQWGYAAWFATLIGVLEFAGAVGLLIPKVTRPAILGLTLIMFGAAYTHIANAEGAQVLRPLIFLMLLWTLWWLRRGSGSTVEMAERAEDKSE